MIEVGSAWCFVYSRGARWCTLVEWDGAVGFVEFWDNKELLKVKYSVKQ